MVCNETLKRKLIKELIVYQTTFWFGHENVIFQYLLPRGRLQNRMRHQYSVEDDLIFIKVSTQKLVSEILRQFQQQNKI